MLEIVVSSRDVTERRNAEQQLRDALEENRFLLRELNHRVKNNLRMVLSLIRLKDSRIGDAADLSDLASQVNAIQSVHEQLQQSDSVTHVSFPAYVDSLLSSVFSQWRGDRVVVESAVEVADLPTRTAMTLGLIVNELATNAMKHGFEPGSTPRFAIALRSESQGERLVLTVSNSGRPFPEDVNLDNPATLGLRLVSSLVGQLEGRLEVQRTPQPVFTVRFPAS